MNSKKFEWQIQVVVDVETIVLQRTSPKTFIKVYEYTYTYQRSPFRVRFTQNPFSFLVSNIFNAKLFVRFEFFLCIICGADRKN